MKISPFIILFILGIFWATAESCLECGEECKKLCGTKQFKACCFNYLRKRTTKRRLEKEIGPDLRLEVSLANSAIRRSLSNGQLPSYGDYLPLAALLEKQNRQTPVEQGHLQLIYDA